MPKPSNDVAAQGFTLNEIHVTRQTLGVLLKSEACVPGLRSRLHSVILRDLIALLTMINVTDLFNSLVAAQGHSMPLGN